MLVYNNTRREVMKNLQTCVLILGMHRSGTSALGGVLSIFGVDMGKELLAPSYDNPKGFFENKDIVNFNDKVLFKFLYTRWDDIASLPQNWENSSQLEPLYLQAKNLIKNSYKDISLFGIKDPRMSILLPFWKKVFFSLDIDLKVIISLRDVGDVAKSLDTRNGFTLYKSQILWVKYNLEAEYHSRGLSRVFIKYEDLLSDISSVKTLLEKKLAIEFSIPPEEVKEKVSNFLDMGLNHKLITGKKNRYIHPLVITVTDILNSFSSKEDDIKNEDIIILNESSQEYALNSLCFNQNLEYKELLEEKDEQLKNLNIELEKRSRIIIEKGNELRERDKIKETLNVELERRSSIIVEKSNEIRAIKESSSVELEKRSSIIIEKSNEIRERDKIMAKRKATIERLSAELQQYKSFLFLVKKLIQRVFIWN
jgi:hypothetical protein